MGSQCMGPVCKTTENGNSCYLGGSSYADSLYSGGGGEVPVTETVEHFT